MYFASRMTVSMKNYPFAKSITFCLTCKGCKYCPLFPIQPPTHTATLLYQTVCVRKQREGQDLPRLLAGVMHKTDPVVYMQRQKEREGRGWGVGEGGGNVLIEGGEQG